MATKKTTTTTKTKTSKTRARSTSRAAATSAKRTTSKSVNKPKIAVKKSVKRVSDRLKQIRMLHIVNLLMSTVLAVYAGLSMTATRYSVEVPYLAKDELTSSTDTTLVPASRVLFDIDIRWLLIGALGLAGIYSLLVLTRWKSSYELALKGRIYLWRWVSLALSGALVVSILALILGLTSIVTIKLLAAMVIIASAANWLAERQNEKSTTLVWSAFATGLFASTVVGGIMLATLLATNIYGMVNLPWYTYAATATAALGCLLTGLTAYLQHRRYNLFADYVFVEQSYVLIGLLTRVSFAVVLILGMQS